MSEEQNNYVIEQKEKVKITRSVSGKYGWDYSLLGDPEGNLDKIDRLERKLKERFKVE